MLIFTVLLGQLLFQNHASSNGTAYQQYSGPLIGNLVPVKEERVEILSEDLDIQFIPRTTGLISNPIMNAQVDVTYTLQNISAEDIDVPIAFLQVGDHSDWSIQLDGKEVLVEGEKEFFAGDVSGDRFIKRWIDPYTYEKYELRHSPSAFPIPAQTFTIRLKKNQQHILEVSYAVETGMDEKRGVNAVYRFDYLLYPASYWSDFHNLNIHIHVPFAHKMYSSLPLEKVDQENWLGYFSQLPEEELQLFISPTKGTWGGLVNSKRGILFILVMVLLIMWLIQRYLLPHLSKRAYFLTHIVLTGVVGWITYVTLTRYLMGYPFTIFQYALLFGVIGGLVYKLMLDLRKN
jgi:hypothetical protein